MEKLAIFDVDYTLTKRETAMEFMFFMMKKNPKFIIHFPKSAISAVLYAIKVYDAGKAKEKFLGFIDGIEEKRMQDTVKEFYRERLSKILYKDAIDTIKKLRAEGYRIILISASAEFYLNQLYNIKEVDKVMGTRFEVVDGKHGSKIIGVNCKGEEKVKRLKEYIKKEGIQVDFKNSYMFSDSMADLPLFKLVGKPYLINARKKRENIEVLHWK
ncbi:HAD-IB family hydrolase [Clostridium sp. KNHs214]|uniref:HAD-IB family hydrolase n=1 Tax=Clostridium sp. KNHs214 TaxID=1540257 RepID=UPI0005544DE1|nr:HAD-IB family hydrolase [Clostridium sp. KNHs214]